MILRLKLRLREDSNCLNLKGVNQIKCSGCGKLFQPKRIRKFKNNFCKECMKKKVRKPSIEEIVFSLSSH